MKIPVIWLNDFVKVDDIKPADLAAKLAIAPDDPGAFHLHSNERGELVQYARELCAEIFDPEKGIWLNPKGRPNHYWDCEVMALALAYVLGVRNRAHPDDAHPQTRRAPAPLRGSRPTWRGGAER